MNETVEKSDEGGFAVGINNGPDLVLNLPVDGKSYHWDVCRDGKKLTIHVEECE